MGIATPLSGTETSLALATMALADQDWELRHEARAGGHWRMAGQAKCLPQLVVMNR